MKKVLSKKGFTLIELLAVIVILGVIMLIAIPSIAGLITNSKKDSFISTTGAYIDSVRKMATSGTVDFQIDPTKATVVSFRTIELEKTNPVKAKSTFGAVWDTSDSATSAYVVIRNERTAADPRYTYFVTAKDQAGNCMALIEEGTAKRSNVTTGCSITSITADSTTLTVGGSNATLDSAHIYLK